MIVYACLARLADGTPLSATTDFASDADPCMQEGKRCVKLLRKQLSKFGKRVCLQAEEITVHYVTDDCTAYVVVCEPNYPHILAFSFLDELMKEFNILYTASVVKSVRRPYAFIEFDTFLQKTRQKYNSTRALASRLNLAEMTTDLNLHPPSYIKMHQLEPPPSPSVTSRPSNVSTASHSPKTLGLSNGTVANGVIINKDVSTVGVTLRLRPISWYGWLAVVLAAPCVFLDIYRGAVAISMSSLEELDGSSPWHGIFFLTEMVFQIMQVHMLRKYNKFRKLGTLGCAILVLILNGFLFDVRDMWICLVYIFVSLSLMVATFRRPFERKLPRFHV
ncbi:vesicle-trafficking protein SEC22a-like [Homarus americanus]|uniref:Vesicle-trafficking protein SEC22a-like n=1 Tax=Homarus americanus TaxID=6706 RepID=A0A8J5JBH9_HOMAM|nr:vesicle-trafficking protein SEC22a-like [Homarus americanus]KAG7155055.1 Vesicle-trafficking protein SEC22a-like [Homarus americanus]